jgi:hypothetical protein
MPITIDVKPGETKVVNVVRKGYVTRPLKLDGSKTRIVVGLVSEAAAAKRHGKSLDAAVAEADRAAASLAADDADTVPATSGTKTARGARATDMAKATAAAEKADVAAAAQTPGPAPVKHSAVGKTLAPNPFGD